MQQIFNGYYSDNSIYNPFKTIINMKKLLFLTSLMALFCLPFTFTACGSDDENDGPNNNGTEQAQFTEAQLTDNGNQLILVYSASAGGFTVTCKWTCDFQNDKLTRSILETTFPNEKAAQASYEASMKDKSEDDPTIYTLKGNVVTADNTESLRGADKSVIKITMEETAKRYGKK